MAEQYVFSVAFDRYESDISVGENGACAVWAGTLKEIAEALQMGSLAPLESDRWEEYGDGCIFWGTRAECAAVRDVLQQFEVEIDDERNIEAGYYSTETTLYYVSEAGDVTSIDGVASPAAFRADANDVSVSSVQSIPLDAYPIATADLDAVARLKTVGTLAFYLAERVDPELPPSDLAEAETVAALAAILTESTPAEAWDVEGNSTTDMEAEATISTPPDETYFDAIPNETIRTNTVHALEIRIAALEADLASRPAPERLTELEVQLAAARDRAELIESEKVDLAQQLDAKQRDLEESEARASDAAYQTEAEAISTRQLLQAEIANRDRAVVQLEAQRDELQQQLAAKARAIVSLEAQLAGEKERADAAVAPDALVALQQQIDARDRDVTALETQLHEARSQAQAAIPPEQLQAQQSQLDEAMQARAQLESQLGDRDLAMAQLEAELAARLAPEAQQSLQDQLDRERQARAQLESQLGDRDLTMAQLEAELAAHIAPEAQQLLQDQLDAQTEAISTLEDQLAKARAAVEHHVDPKRYRALEQQLAQAKSEATTRIDPIEHRTLQRKSAALVGQIKQLQAQLEKAQEPRSLWASLTKRMRQSKSSR
ncbi:MAG: hypothetical protein AAFY57_08315 [Cyanobacteria bacterium J06642_2]